MFRTFSYHPYIAMRTKHTTAGNSPCVCNFMITFRTNASPSNTSASAETVSSATTSFRKIVDCLLRRYDTCIPAYRTRISLLPRFSFKDRTAIVAPIPVGIKFNVSAFNGNPPVFNKSFGYFFTCRLINTCKSGS